MTTPKGYVERNDVVMVPRSYLRPEFINYANKAQEVPNPYDVGTTAQKLEKISKKRHGNKYKRDYEFHDTLDNFLDRRKTAQDIPAPARIKMKPTKESKHYEDMTRESNFQDAYTGTLAALRKIKQETIAEEGLRPTSTKSSEGASTSKSKPKSSGQLAAIERLRMRRILLDAEQEEKTGEYKAHPFTPKKTRGGTKYGQSGSGYKYVTLFDKNQRVYML